MARWRQIEKARESAPGPGEVDRAAPPPDNRTDFEAASPVRTASTGEEPLPARPGRAFDAVEGTPLDPLANKTWDLTSPKTVPSFGPEPAAQPAPPPARAARPKRGRKTAPRSAEAGLPPGVRMPPR